MHLHSLNYGSFMPRVNTGDHAVVDESNIVAAKRQFLVCFQDRGAPGEVQGDPGAREVQGDPGARVQGDPGARGPP